MHLHAALLIAMALSGTSVRAAETTVETQDQYVASRQQVDAARRDVFDARSQLEAVRAEQRLQSALAVAEPERPTERNPESDRLQTEVRALELHVRRLAERMAPAHPEMMAAEAELAAVRGLLAKTPEVVIVDGSRKSAATQQSQATASLHWKVAEAQNDLDRAELRLDAALAIERQSLSRLLAKASAPSVKNPEPTNVAASDELAPPVDTGWVFAGVASAALLLILIASRSRAEKPRPTMSPKTPRMPSSSRRIVYSPAQSPAPIASKAKSRPAPIVPRRRVS